MKTKVGTTAFLVVLSSLFLIHSFACRDKAPLVNPSLKSYQSALKLIGAGKNRQAIEALKTIIRRDSAFCPSYSKLVRLYRAQHQLPVAEEYLTELCSRNPRNPYIYFALGLLHKENGDAQQAMDELKRSIEMGNRWASVFVDLVNIYENRKNSSDAIGYLDSLTQTAQHPAAIYYGLGLAFSKQKQWDKSIHALDRCLKLHPGLLAAYLEKSNVYFNTGELQSGLDIQAVGYEKAVAIGDIEMEHRLLAERGRILKLAGKPKEAMKSFESALVIARRIGDKKSEGIYLGNLGAIHAGLAEYPQAL